MDEYIKREDAIKAIENDLPEQVRYSREDAADCIRYMDAADVAPVRHGKWEWDTEDIYRCSNCAEKSHVKEVMGHPDWDYCPSCGAKMDGGDSDEAD